MKPKQKKQPLPETKDKQAATPDFDAFLDLDAVASTTECTGLIPTPPASEAQAEAYTDLYAIPQPVGKSKKTSEKK